MSLKPCDQKRVLIADDDAATRTLYEAIVTETFPGVSVDLAANGIEAVEMFETGSHGTIIMDLHMPVLDGLAAYRRIDELCGKKDLALPFTVFCTAYAPPKAFADIIKSEKPHSFLHKPMSSDQLLSALRGHCDADG